MKKIIKYAVFIPVLCLISCSDFLEPKSQSEYVPRDVAALDELLLGGAYISPVDVSYGNLFSVLGLFDDDVATRPDLPAFKPEGETNYKQVRMAFTWSRDMIDYLQNYNVYGNVYNKIVVCNAVLDYAGEVAGEEENRNYLVAQAYALRAYYYFYLVNLYGKPYAYDPQALGVPLKLDANLSTDHMPRNTVGEVHERVLADLLEAERLMKTLPEADRIRKNKRVNLPFIELLLSRVYLYMEKWPEAMAYGERVFTNYDYGLQDLNSIAPPDGTSDSYPDYLTWTNPENIFLMGDRNDVLSLVTRSVNLVSNNVPTNLCVVSPELINCYQDDDLRKDRYLLYEAVAPDETPHYRVPVSKINLNNNYRIDLGWGQAWGIVFRLPEAYLNAAEAAAMLYKAGEGDEYRTKALDWMKTLRAKRYLNGTNYDYQTSSADDLVNFVRDERRRELCFENHRWFDLRRYGMEELIHVWYDTDHNGVLVRLQKNDPGFTLMLPKAAMEKNAALVQNESR